MDVRFSERRWDAFGGSPSESSAAKFGTEGVAIYARKPHPSTSGAPIQAARPKPDATLEALGDGCATLTPRIKGHVRRLESGQILEVVSDDPAAAEGVPAWTRLTGNELVVTAAEGDRLRFYIRKK